MTRARANECACPIRRALREVLASHGFDPDSIDMVINTHLHWDHWVAIRWTIRRRGAGASQCPLHHAARRTEHAREQHPRDAVSYRAVNYEPLIEAGRMHLLDGEWRSRPALRCALRLGTIAT